MDGMPSEEVAISLAKEGLFLSHGDFYAATLVERLGFSAEGVVRVGCACYTTADEVERLLDALGRLARGGR
jgi:selenocysteine lyase/cysteine desulfurase